MNLRTAILILTAIVFTNNSFAQKLKTVKVENNGNSSFEEYQVLSSDPSVKHGWYKKYKYKELEVSGYYKNGLKDSIWTEYSGKQIINQGNYSEDKKNGLWTFYHHNSKNIVAKGHFLNDKKNGIWNTYDSKNSLLNEYDFDEKTYLKYTKDQTDKNSTDSSLLLVNNEYKMVKLDTSANFFGSSSNLIGYIQRNIRYPEVALDNGIEGSVVITFIIDQDGNTSQFEVTSPPIGGGLDREALRVVQLAKDYWLPAFHNGIPVSAKINYSVRFKLSK